jgi:hypothetical protein
MIEFILAWWPYGVSAAGCYLIAGQLKSYVRRFKEEHNRRNLWPVIEGTEICGVTLSWGMNPTLLYRKKDRSGTYILPGKAVMIFNPECFPDGPGTWPKHPETGEKLPIYRANDLVDIPFYWVLIVKPLLKYSWAICKAPVKVPIWFLREILKYLR